MAVREFTNKLRDALDEGMVSAQAVADMAMKYMSEDEVKDMCLSNDILFEEDEDEEDDEDDEEE
jgi:hypothetical protein